jgi:transposase
MARAYSADLRTRIVQAIEDGLSVTEATEVYQVSRRTVYNYLTLARETGNLKPRVGKRGRKRKLESHREAVQQAISRNPNLTLQELKEQLGLNVCTSTLWLALQRWNISVNKPTSRRRTTHA